MRHTRRLAIGAAFIALIAAAPAQAAPSTYRVTDVRTLKDRNAVARTGAVIVAADDHGSVTVTASRSDLRALRRAGFRVVSTARKTDFPPADSAYHNYAELSADVTSVIDANSGDRPPAHGRSAPPSRAVS